MSQVTSPFGSPPRSPRRPRRSSGFPFPRLLAFLASARLSARPPPKLGAPRSSRLANNPPSRRLLFSAPPRLRAPVRASWAVKPRSPAPFALRRANPPSLATPPLAPTSWRPLVASAPPRPGRPPFAWPSPKLQRSRPVDVGRATPSAASQAACGEPHAARSAEPLTQPLGTISILHANPNTVKPFFNPILRIGKIAHKTALCGIFCWFRLCWAVLAGADGSDARVFVRIRIYRIVGICRISFRPTRALSHNRKSRQAEYGQAPARRRRAAMGES